MDLSALPEEPLERLAAYIAAREREHDEKERVRRAMAVPPAERTLAQRNTIAYSRFGTDSSCGY